jgi:hypothetical protein
MRRFATSMGGVASRLGVSNRWRLRRLHANRMRSCGCGAIGDRRRGRVREKKQAGTSALRHADDEALDAALAAFAGVMEEEG